MICTKIHFKIIDIEFHLIEIERLLCNTRISLVFVLLNCSFKMSKALSQIFVKSQFIPTPNQLFLSPCPFLSSRTYLLTL